MEICIKKVHGSSVFERYDRLFAGAMVSFAAGTALSCLLMKNNTGLLLVIVIAGVGLFAVDGLILGWKIQRWDKKHIVSILKGGAL